MNRKYIRGFTIIELMLSMAFIAAMLLAIAMCILQLSAIYTRGETLRQVNQASRTLAADFRQAFASADPDAITITPNGRLCTGKVSYIWTNPQGTFTNNQFSDNGTFRLIRIVDSGGKYCEADSALPVHRNSRINRATTNPAELLEVGDRSLRIHSLQVVPAGGAPIAKQRLYIITMVVGTDDTAVIDATGRCRPPNNVTGQDSNINYCAINEINLTVRAGIE